MFGRRPWHNRRPTDVVGKMQKIREKKEKQRKDAMKAAKQNDEQEDAIRQQRIKNELILID